jgi:hypothetical protein
LNKIIKHKTMKKTINFLTALVIGLSMVACSGGAGPEKTAEKYLQFLAAGELDKAAELGTEDTKQLLGLLKSFMGDEKPENPNEVKDVKCEVSEDGETATCTYCCTEEGESDKIDMKKVGGKWLVDMKKETPDFDDMDFDMDFDMDMDFEEELEDLNALIEGEE